MKPKKPNAGRAVDRVRKTITFPDKLAHELQALADDRYHGDFVHAVLSELAKKYPSAREFLRTNTTRKHSAKK